MASASSPATGEQRRVVRDVLLVPPRAQFGELGTPRVARELENHLPVLVEIEVEEAPPGEHSHALLRLVARKPARLGDLVDAHLSAVLARESGGELLEAAAVALLLDLGAAAAGDEGEDADGGERKADDEAAQVHEPLSLVLQERAGHEEREQGAEERDEGAADGQDPARPHGAPYWNDPFGAGGEEASALKSSLGEGNPPILAHQAPGIPFTSAL